jgi:hypothetical protein
MCGNLLSLFRNVATPEQFPRGVLCGQAYGTGAIACRNRRFFIKEENAISHVPASRDSLTGCGTIKAAIYSASTMTAE